ncbi:MFS transporter [Scytonema hofmannii]|uniref:MFS transporter n=1 Tax=Scytonema hofmannii TaxID=34078 RepID=UPI000344A0F9|nr:MFS transporter [Scytonema hofmannii]
MQAQGYSQSIAGLADTQFALLLSGLSPWAGQWADRCGPRIPLIVGPFLVGLGFLLMAFVGLTRGASEYWTTFFPGIVVFGLGMAITVAPLTTAVMGSVGTEYAGTASGINNAVSRTAGVLAIAIVGSLALSTYSLSLQEHTTCIHLSNAARLLLQSQARQLGQISPIVGIAPENVDAVATAVKLAFVDTFRLVMIICAGLAWLSAIMAALLVGSGEWGTRGPLWG